MASTERRIYTIDDLAVGMEASLTKSVSASDVQAFADVTGDHNPVHLDEAYAATTPFKVCIAHGMLSAGMISAVFGMQLPGPGAVYISQTLNFRSPVKVGDVVTTRVKLVEVMTAKRRVRFECSCFVDDKLVLDGEAVLMVPKGQRQPSA